MITIAVTGGRNYKNRQRLYEALDAVFAAKPFDRLVHGGASGADSLSEAWCRERKVAVEAVPADWAAYGKSAGPKRNRRMLDLFGVDLLVAFSGGAGTHDCMNAARERRIRVLVVNDKSKSADVAAEKKIRAFIETHK